MKTYLLHLWAALFALVLPLTTFAQVNSGSDGHDGALNPTSNLVIDMADHPDGIYHYTSVNIPSGVTVSFIPNAGNKPVVWLVQTSCKIYGVVNLAGKPKSIGSGSLGGPGGFRGGAAGGQTSLAESGLGPGGGSPGAFNSTNRVHGGGASFATVGTSSGAYVGFYASPGDIYGSQYLIPLIGGSGGGGSVGLPLGGTGGGGAILIAANAQVILDGTITVQGGSGDQSASGPGSGGAIRIITSPFSGNGNLLANGGNCSDAGYPPASQIGGDGRIRLDIQQNTFTGSSSGQVSQGFQPIIMLPPNQSVGLDIFSVGGVSVSANPAGQLTSPDVIVPANQQNPVPIVVHCTNIPLNTEVIVDVKPSNGATVRAIALNTSGTQASSTATVLVNMPRGGGTIQAKAVSGIVLASAYEGNDMIRSLAETGWTADGERFAQVEVSTTLGGSSQLAYLTESGKRFLIR